MDWWDVLPAGEKKVLRDVMAFIREAKEDPIMAAAAAKWEPSLICFIKMRLMGQNRIAQARANRLKRAGCTGMMELRVEPRRGNRTPAAI